MSIGVVAIGRNEGKRLEACLESVLRIGTPIVYVDSGSSDASVPMARSKGAEVIELDLRIPFTAGRARNEGFDHLRRIAPHVRYVQFIDGDSELAPGWLDDAARFLDAENGIAVVCGRLREKYPDRSIYNMLCDMEWDGPSGEVRKCGGIAMMRVQAFAFARGFRSDLIAGEEPELCVRLRAAGWRIWCLDAAMAVHDADMTHFGQWWRRMQRGGYAYAQGAHLHGAPPERHCIKEIRSIWLWAVGIPLLTLAMTPWLGSWSLVLLLMYPAQVFRLAANQGFASRRYLWRAGFLVLGKFPEVMGQIRYIFGRYRKQGARLIEYK